MRVDALVQLAYTNWKKKMWCPVKRAAAVNRSEKRSLRLWLWTMCCTKRPTRARHTPFALEASSVSTARIRLQGNWTDSPTQPPHTHTELRPLIGVFLNSAPSVIRICQLAFFHFSKCRFAGLRLLQKEKKNHQYEKIKINKKRTCPGRKMKQRARLGGVGKNGKETGLV